MQHRQTLRQGHAHYMSKTSVLAIVSAIVLTGSVVDTIAQNIVREEGERCFICIGVRPGSKCNELNAVRVQECEPGEEAKCFILPGDIPFAFCIGG